MQRRLPRPPLDLVVVAIALCLGLVPAASRAETPGQTREATVTAVLDGQTIRVRLPDGREEVVRYIGIGTPEIRHPKKGPEPYAAAATAANRQLVEGKQVILMIDAQVRDPDGRLLAYVFTVADGQQVNTRLVYQGYAETVTVPPNVTYSPYYRTLQRYAQTARRGIWEDGEALQFYVPKPSGVIARRSLKRYWHADDPAAKTFPPEEVVYFDTLERASEAGYEPAPGYATFRERDETARRDPLSAAYASTEGAGAKPAPNQGAVSKDRPSKEPKPHTPRIPGGRRR